MDSQQDIIVEERKNNRLYKGKRWLNEGENLNR